jgi:hypothetical protein
MNRVRNWVLPGLFLTLASGAGCQRSLVTCDITQRSCQEDVYFHDLSLRGDGYDPFGGLPPVTVITEDEYRQQLIAQAQAETAQNGPSPWDKAMLLLHFTAATGSSAGDAGVGDGGASNDAGVDNSTIEDEVTHVLAFYSSQTKTVTIVAHPDQTGSDAESNAMITLAHELIHSLQDRELDLSKTDSFQTTDGYLAYDTIIEGDARFYETLFANDLLHLGWSQSNITKLAKEQLQNYYDNFGDLGAPLFAAQDLIYPLGELYEATEYQSGGNAAVRHGYAKEPPRTVGFLVNADGTAPPVGSGNVCPAPAVALASLPTAGADQLGALPLYTFLRGWNVDHATAYATAQSWTGDFLRVQAKADLTTTAVAWRIELSAPPPATVVQALTSSGELAVKSDSQSLEITVSDSQSPLTWQAVSCQ